MIIVDRYRGPKIFQIEIEELVGLCYNNKQNIIVVECYIIIGMNNIKKNIECKGWLVSDPFHTQVVVTQIKYEQ